MKVKLNPYVCYRYESKIKGGKTFIFHLDYGKIYLSNFEAYRILEFVDFYAPDIYDLYHKFSGTYIEKFIKNMVDKEVLYYED